MFSGPEKCFRALALGRLPIKATDALKWVFGPPKIRSRDPKYCIGSFKWKFESLKREFGTRNAVLGPRCCDVAGLQADFGTLNVFSTPENAF